MLRPAVVPINDQARAPAGPVGVALVGLDQWGPHFLNVLADNPDAHVRWICDLDSESLMTYRRRSPGALMTTRIERVLGDPDVEAVIIATPVETHYELAARALRAGKHVFVENPLARSSELADRLAALASDWNRILTCGPTFVSGPPVRAVKRTLEAGALGDIYFISSTRGAADLDQRDASVIWDLGPQHFSILLYWLNEVPTHLRAIGPDPIATGIADVAFVNLSFDSGVIANVELSRLVPSKLARTVLVGSERTVIYEDGPPATESYGSPTAESYEQLRLEVADFINTIRHGERMDFHADLARNVVRIAEAADRSLHEGGREVALEDADIPVQLPVRRHLALA